MKKNTLLSIIAIFVCFLIGYAAFQTTVIVRNLISDMVTGCEPGKDARCSDSVEGSPSTRGGR